MAHSLLEKYRQNKAGRGGTGGEPEEETRAAAEPSGTSAAPGPLMTKYNEINARREARREILTAAGMSPVTPAPYKTGPLKNPADEGYFTVNSIAAQTFPIAAAAWTKAARDAADARVAAVEQLAAEAKAAAPYTTRKAAEDWKAREDSSLWAQTVKDREAGDLAKAARSPEGAREAVDDILARWTAPDYAGQAEDLKKDRQAAEQELSKLLASPSFHSLNVSKADAAQLARQRDSLQRQIDGLKSQEEAVKKDWDAFTEANAFYNLPTQEQDRLWRQMDERQKEDTLWQIANEMAAQRDKADEILAGVTRQSAGQEKYSALRAEAAPYLDKAHRLENQANRLGQLPGAAERTGRGALSMIESWAAGHAGNVRMLNAVVGPLYDDIRKKTKDAALPLLPFSGTFVKPLEELSDTLSEAGARDITSATVGLPRAGRQAIQGGIASGQMLMDAAAGGGNVMAPMVVRSFGNGAEEARRKGYDLDTQMKLGLATAATEYFTEKLFGGNPYDRSLLTGEVEAGIVNRAVGRLTEWMAGSENARMLTAFLSTVPVEMLNEGLEEVAAGILEPLWEANITGTDYEPDWNEILDEGVVGVIMGALGIGSHAALAAVTGQNGLAEYGAKVRADGADERQMLLILEDSGNADAVRLAQELRAKLAAGGNLSDAELGKLSTVTQLLYPGVAAQRAGQEIREQYAGDQADFRRELAAFAGEGLKAEEGTPFRVLAEAARKKLARLETLSDRELGRLALAYRATLEAAETAGETAAETEDAALRAAAEAIVPAEPAAPAEPIVPAAALPAPAAETAPAEPVTGQDGWKLVSRIAGNASAAGATGFGKLLLTVYDQTTDANAYIDGMVRAFDAGREGLAEDEADFRGEAAPEPALREAYRLGRVKSEADAAFAARTQGRAAEQEVGFYGRFGQETGEETAESDESLGAAAVPAPVRGQSDEGAGGRAGRVSGLDAARPGGGVYAQQQSGQRTERIPGRAARFERTATERSREGAEIRAAVDAAGVEAVSARSQGIARATERKTMKLIPRAIYTEEMKRISADAARRGVRVYFFTGAMEFRRADGTVFLSRGTYSPSESGPRIWISADDARANLSQLYRHELFHHLAATDAALVEEAKQQILRTHDDEQLERMAEAYAKYYGKIYTDASGDQADEETRIRGRAFIYEEILADAYAGIDILDYYSAYEGATAFSGAVRQTVQERRGLQDNPVRGPPEAGENENAARGGSGETIKFSGGAISYNPETMTFRQQIDAILDGIINRKTTHLNMGQTPELYGEFAFNTSLPVLITAKHIEQMNAKSVDDDHLHGISRAKLARLPGAMADPVMVMVSRTFPDSLVVVTDILVKEARENGKSEQLPVVLILAPDGNGNYNNLRIPANIAKSAYGKRGFKQYLIAAFSSDRMLYCNYEKSRQLQQNPGVQFPNRLPHGDFSENIAKYVDRVKKNRAGKQKIISGQDAEPQAGERFSLASDRAYLSAVERGDMETAQRMVDEAARAAGYDLKAYHGTPRGDFTVFDRSTIGTNTDYGWYGRGFYFTTKQDVAKVYAGYLPQSRVMSVYLRADRLFDFTAYEGSAGEIMERMLGKSYADSRGDITEAQKIRRAEDFTRWLAENGYDGVKAKGQIMILDSSQAKLSDPVTYDDAGNVVPLSQRFNAEQEDIRFSLAAPSDDGGFYQEEQGAKFSLVTDPETLNFLENQEHVTVYRAMQVIDGRLYPPMAAKVKDGGGKAALVEPTETGVWYRSDERPDLVDRNGKFKLDKGNGTSVPAAYNPYFHSSASPLNDQFTSAYNRPNMVVVEGEIPRSELTSGYRAAGAKNAVGETSWHSGPVAGELKGEKARRVFLSRWFKVNRVLSDAETAEKIADILRGENVPIPSNVVTPSLLAELRKTDVPIVETITENGKVRPKSEWKAEWEARGENVKFSPASDQSRPAPADLRADAEIQQLQAENESLRRQVEHWKQQTRETENRPLRPGDVHKAANQLLHAYGAEMEPAAALEIETALGEIGRAVRYGELSYGAAKDRLIQHVAGPIIEAAVEQTNSETVKACEDVPALLRRPMTISADSVEDIVPRKEWNDWRKANRKYVNVSINGRGTPVDVLYQEMSQSHPELFPADLTHPADQVKRMIEVAQSLEPVFRNPFDSYRAEAVEYCANDALNLISSEDIRTAPPTMADRAKRSAEQSKAQASARAERQIQKARADRDRKIQAVRDHYMDAARVRAENRNRTEDEHRLLALIRRLTSKKVVVSQEMIESIGKELAPKIQMILSGGMNADSAPLTGKSFEKLIDLQHWYEMNIKSNPDYTFDERVEAKLQRLNQRHIRELSREELADLIEVFLAIRHKLENDKYLIQSADRRAAAIQGRQVIDDVEQSAGSSATNPVTAIVRETLSPLREVARLTGHRGNDPLYLATVALADGQRAAWDFQRRAGKRFEKWTGDRAFLKSIMGKDARPIELKGYGVIALDRHGQVARNGDNQAITDREITVKITPAMRMELYLNSFNPQNMRHMRDGGVTVPDWKLYRKGKIAEAYDKGTTLKLLPGDVRALADGMTEEEKAFAQAARDYFRTMSKEEINRTSVALLGYELAQVDEYYPITTNKDFLRGKEFGALTDAGTVAGQGFLQERITGAAGPIMLRDMPATLNQSIEGTGRYVGLAIPVRNFSKLTNVITGSVTQTGSWNGYESGVLDAIRHKWSGKDVAYLEKMMRDVQTGGRSAADELGGLLAGLRSSYAGAVLTLNLSVAMKQAASYPTAAAVVGFGPLAKAMTNWHKTPLWLIDAYTPDHWYRRQGYGTQELGDLKRLDDSALQRLLSTKALNWIQGVDVGTTLKLWKAAEYAVQRDYPDLEKGTDAQIRAGESLYYKAVAEVYNAIIEETQPNYSTMQRPQILRSENALTQTLMMFKTQPFQNFNILYDAIGNLRAKQTQHTNALATANEEGGEARLKAAKAELKSAKTRASRAILSQAAQLAVFSAMTLAWGALRGKLDKWEDEDGNVTVWSVLAGFGKDFLSGIFSMVPGGSEVFEALDYLISRAAGKSETYDGFNASSLSALTDLVKMLGNAESALIRTVDALRKGEEMDPLKLHKELRSIASAISKVTNLPYDNVANIIDMGIYWGTKFAAGGAGKHVPDYLYLRWKNPDVKANTSKYYGLLTRALKAGDLASYREISRRMQEDARGKLSGEDIRSHMKGIIKTAEKDAPGTFSRQAKDAVGFTEDEYQKPAEEKFTADDLDSKAYQKYSTQQAAEYRQIENALQKLPAWKEMGPEARDRLRGYISTLTKENALAASSGGRYKPEDRWIGWAGGGSDWNVSEEEALLWRLAYSITSPDKDENGKITASKRDNAIAQIRAWLPGLTDEELNYMLAFYYEKAADGGRFEYADEALDALRQTW